MDEHGIENHPELMDPDWQRHAEKEAWTDFRRTKRRASRGRRLAIFVVVLVVLAGAGFAFYSWGRTTSEQYAGGTSAAATTTAPTDLPEWARVDLSRPFDNTPAQNWAEGIAGLTVPAATKVGTFSAQQVSSALEQIKQAIAVSSLDLDVLQQHNIEKYAALLAPDARGDVRAHPDTYVVLLADGYHLLPVQPRLNGSLTVAAGRTGELLVHADYVVAYAFDPGSHQIIGPGDMEPYVRIQADYVLRAGSGWQKGSTGLWLDLSHLYFTEAACGALKQGRVAPAFSEPGFTGASLTPEPGQFDPNQPMPTGDNCD